MNKSLCRSVSEESFPPHCRSHIKSQCGNHHLLTSFAGAQQSPARPFIILFLNAGKRWTIPTVNKGLLGPSEPATVGTADSMEAYQFVFPHEIVFSKTSFPAGATMSSDLGSTILV